MTVTVECLNAFLSGNMLAPWTAFHLFLLILSALLVFFYPCMPHLSQVLPSCYSPCLECSDSRLILEFHVRKLTPPWTLSDRKNSNYHSSKSVVCEALVCCTVHSHLRGGVTYTEMASSPRLPCEGNLGLGRSVLCGVYSGFIYRQVLSNFSPPEGPGSC